MDLVADTLGFSDELRIITGLTEGVLDFDLIDIDGIIDGFLDGMIITSVLG